MAVLRDVGRGLGIAHVLLAHIASALLGWWLLGAGLLAVGIAMVTATFAPRGGRRW